ncbi:MAG: TlpA disulfide reductase family protein [bacterium]
MSYKVYRKTLIICLMIGLMASLSLAMGKAPKKSTQQFIPPNFTLVDLNGGAHSLSEYRGKVVVLNFWATWCPPCRAEMPSMQKMFDTWSQDKYVMLAVNIAQPREDVLEFARQNKYTFPILLDIDSSVARLYQVRGIPATFIIGKDGQLVQKIVGAREWMIEEIELMLDGK